MRVNKYQIRFASLQDSRYVDGYLINGNKTFYREGILKRDIENYGGWAIRLDIFELCLAAGTKYARMRDRKTGRVYSASIMKIKEKGTISQKGGAKWISMQARLWNVVHNKKPARVP